MPCARITVTVWVASNTPTLLQITAIQNQEYDRRFATASICESYYVCSGPPENAANPHDGAASSLAFDNSWMNTLTMLTVKIVLPATVVLLSVFAFNQTATAPSS